MHRRSFIQRTCTAALLGPMALAAAQNRRVRIGFLGAVHSHAAAKIQIARDSADWELIGVADSTTAGEATAKRLNVKVLPPDEILAKAEVIAIESAVRDQAKLALLALKAGKHIHLEKPGAAALPEFTQLVNEARERRLLLQTGYMWRHNPGFHKIFEAVREGWLGDVVMVRAHMSNNLAPSSRAEWAEFKGGSMFEQGSHMIDAIVRLLGKPRQITSTLRTHGSSTDTLKDNNIAILEYPKATAVLTNSSLQRTAAPQRSFEVIGSEGWAKLEPIEQPRLQIELRQAAGPYAKGAQEVPLSRFERYVGDFVELAAAVRGERQLSVLLDDELLVAEATLRASNMHWTQAPC
ncbi:MAG TPA: Gfo/Idh/MocA family oxidoreductase [Methylomirabilota bacterium]|nr:Gfo/Idh/MocA family oxidoreductase [Methylomirabilota bacterium]